jgi:transcriptional regulator with XRE-family HTH domain
VTVPKAILLLREKAHLSQADLAKRIGGTSFTISRWETGRRAPSSLFLERLAEVAGTNGFTDLHDFFDGRRKSIIAARMKNLQSPGTQRRVSVHDLDALGNFFTAAADFVQDNILFLAVMQRELQDELGYELLLQKLKEINASNVAFRDDLKAAINSMAPYLRHGLRRAEDSARLDRIETMLEIILTYARPKGTDGKAKR